MCYKVCHHPFPTFSRNWVYLQLGNLCSLCNEMQLLLFYCIRLGLLHTQQYTIQHKNIHGTMAAFLQFQIIPNCKVLYLVQYHSMPSCLNTLCTMDPAAHSSLPLPGSPWQDYSFALHRCSLSPKRQDKAQMKHVCSFSTPLSTRKWFSRVSNLIF